MAWTDSRVFRPMVADMFGNVAAFDLDADSIKAALYGNSGTPNNDVTSANSAYAVDQWVVGNEVSQAVQWPAGGVALTGQTVNSGTADVVFFDANDTASGSSATLSGVFGTLVYDDTLAAPVADQGLSYNYFGGSNSVVAGVFTVIWHANGIIRATL